jgi:hypothetical protein
MRAQVALCAAKGKDFRDWPGKGRQDIACRTGK